MDNFDKQSSSSSLSLDKPNSSSRKTRASKKIIKETHHPIYSVRRKNCVQGVSTESLREMNSSSHEDNQMAALQSTEDCRQNSMANLSPSCSSLFRVSRESTLGSQMCDATELEYDVEMNEMFNGCLGQGVDEEEIFNMPVLLDSMAEGMLLTPLAMKKGFSWSHEVDDEFALNLWCD